MIYCGTLAERGNAQIYSYNDTLAKKWQIRQVEEGVITLQNLGGANTDDSTNVGTWEVNGTKAQAWSFSIVNILETGFYEFAPLSNTRLRLDVANGSIDNYANVQVYTSNGTFSQRWLFYFDGLLFE